jgi:putative chitobiose transport system permease protein
MRNGSGRNLTAYGYLLPAMAVLGFFAIYPAGMAVYYSFTDFGAFTPARWVGWENYRAALTDARTGWALLNSVIYLAVTPAVMLLSLGAAMLLHAGIVGGKWVRVILFLPVVTPTIVAGLAFRLLLTEEDGVINTGLAAVGVERVGWLTTYPFTLISAMIVTLWKGFGYYMMIFLAGLLMVPRELEEAATLDGAGRWGVFWHVTLPGIWPVLGLVAVISSISAMKVFDELFVTISGAPLGHQTAVPVVFHLAFERGEFGAASAVSVLLMGAVLVLTLVQLKLMRGASV